MNTRTNRNKTNNTNTFALKSRSIIVTTVAIAALNSVAYAQTNASSGINREAAKRAAQTPTATRRGTAPSTPAGASVRAATAPRKATRATTASTPKSRQTSSPRAVKITIRGNRNDVRQARQQGVQSLQNANAAVAAREAQRAADAEAANANNQAIADANNAFQQQGNVPGYGFVPGFNYGNFGNPIASYGYGTGVYGSTSTTLPAISGATPYGAPNVSFPSFYTNYSPGVYSSYSTFGPFGF